MAMESFGVIGIFSEAARLLYKHFRLFMPFLLAFHLPASCLTVFEGVFLDPSPHPYMSLLKAVGVDNQMWQGSGISQPHATNLSLLIFMFSTLAVAASTNIVAYIYRNADTAGDQGADDSMATRRLVYKHLPDAFFRLFVTDLWAFVAFSMVAIACAVFASILNVVLSVMNSGGPYSRHNQTSFFPLAVFAFVIGAVAMNTVFALAASIAVLEPQKYGRAALRQSMTYVERRPLTIFGVVVLSMAIGGLFSDPFPQMQRLIHQCHLVQHLEPGTFRLVGNVSFHLLSAVQSESTEAIFIQAFQILSSLGVQFDNNLMAEIEWNPRQ